MGKLQSAMEYLMTYGWAILAIAVVMVSLYSLGIFNLGNLQPTATPGSCQVVRTAAQTSLSGQCNNLIPKYVGQFNGQSSYVNVSNANPLNPISAITVCAWINTPTPTKNYGMIVTKGHYDFQYELRIWSTNAKLMFLVVTGGTIHTIFGTTVLSASKWYFSCGTYDGSYLNLYTNGAVDGTPVAVTGSINVTTQNLNVGRNTPNNDYFNGSIADVQIYNTSLDNTSIKALYREGIGGAPIDQQHLIGWWPLNGNANDYSSNNNHGTTTSVIWNANWQSGYTMPAS